MSLCSEDLEEVVEIVGVVRDEGTIVVLSCDDGRRIGVDHRMARAIQEDLEAGEVPQVVVEGWEFL